MAQQSAGGLSTTKTTANKTQQKFLAYDALHTYCGR